MAIRRFDRLGEQRLHCISAGTALRALAFDENSIDFSYPKLAQLLRRIGDTKDDENKNDMRELFRRMIFNTLIDNTDDHEKNHALIMFSPERNGNVRLSAAYDVLPTNSGQGHQEFGVGTDGRDSTLENAMSQCTLFGLQPAVAAKEIVSVIAVVNGWQAHFRATGVSAEDIAQLAEFIDGSELLRQRQEFSAGTYTKIPGKRN